MLTTFSEYQEQARRTQNKDLPLWAMREHALFGMASEVGEIHGLYQKVHQGHVLDEQELMLECGDLMWFLSELLDVNGWTMEEVAKANIEKLRVRYKKEFTADESIKRVDVKKPKREPVRSKYYARVVGNRE